MSRPFVPPSRAFIEPTAANRTTRTKARGTPAVAPGTARKVVLGIVAAVFCGLALRAAYRSYQAVAVNMEFNDPVAALDQANRDDPIVGGSSWTDAKTGEYVTVSTHKSGRKEVTRVPLPRSTARDPAYPAAPASSIPAGTGQPAAAWSITWIKDGPKAHEGPSGATLSGDALWDRCARSVARVEGRWFTRSGFVIGKGLIAMTASPLDLEFVDDVRVSFPAADGPDRGPFPARLAGMDRGRDLALLAVETTLPAFEADLRYEPKPDEMVTVIGITTLDGEAGAAPAHRSGTAAHGQASNPYPIDLEVDPTMSGGVVLDGRGRAIGIAARSANPKGPSSYCLPLGMAQDLLEHLGHTSPDGEEFAVLTSAHRRAVIFRRSALVCGVLAIGLTATQKALEAGGPEKLGAAGITLPRAEFDHMIRGLDAQLAEGLKVQVNRLSAGLSGNGMAQAQPYLLFVNSEAMRRALGEATGDANAFKAKVARLKADNRTILERAGGLAFEIPSFIPELMKDEPRLDLEATLKNTAAGFRSRKGASR